MNEQIHALRAKWEEERGSITRLSELKKRVEELRFEMESATRRGNLERAAQIQYGELPQAERELAKLNASLDGTTPSGNRMLKEEVDDEDIAKIVSKWTGVPVSKMLEGEVKKLVQMEERLRDRVIGQDHALAQVANAWRRTLGQPGSFPPTHREFLDQCHAAGQTRPTPLMLLCDSGRMGSPDILRPKLFMGLKRSSMVVTLFLR